MNDDYLANCLEDLGLLVSGKLYKPKLSDSKSETDSSILSNPIKELKEFMTCKTCSQEIAKEKKSKCWFVWATTKPRPKDFKCFHGGVEIIELEYH